LPHEDDLGRGKCVGLVDEVAEGALQGLDFGGEGAGGGDGGGLFVAQRVTTGGGLVSIVRTDTCSDLPPSGKHFWQSAAHPT
jgi:hypothetical protein